MTSTSQRVNPTLSMTDGVGRGQTDNGIVGQLSVNHVTDASGRQVPVDEAIRRGWLVPANGRRIQGGTMPLGHNLFLDNGRQFLAYLLGGRATLSDYAVAKFSVGTGTTPPNVTDVALESPVSLVSVGAYLKAIDSASFPAPFIVEFLFTLSLADASGNLITEMGLFSASETLLARWVFDGGINKTTDFSPTIGWRIRL